MFTSVSREHTHLQTPTHPLSRSAVCAKSREAALGARPAPVGSASCLPGAQLSAPVLISDTRFFADLDGGPFPA